MLARHRCSSTGIVFVFFGELTSSSPALIILYVSTQFLDGLYIILDFLFFSLPIWKEDNNILTTSGDQTADTMSYASARDRNLRAGNVTFHGVLNDIIEISYTNDMKFILFKCDWVNNQLGKKQDEFNLTMVNFNHPMYKDNHVGNEPFILAGQAEVSQRHNNMHLKEQLVEAWKHNNMHLKEQLVEAWKHNNVHLKEQLVELWKVFYRVREPIGPNVQPLKTQLGNIAKNGMMAPMTYLEWTYMPNELLDRMWKEVTLQKKGKKIDRVSMFIKTRSRIDKNTKKTIIDDEATQVIVCIIYSQFEEHLRDIPAEEQTDMIREQVFTQVMGPDDHGRVCLYGAGKTSSNVVGQNSNVDEMRVELDELRSNYKDLQSKYEKLESIVMSHYETCPQIQSRSEQLCYKLLPGAIYHGKALFHRSKSVARLFASVVFATRPIRGKRLFATDYAADLAAAKGPGFCSDLTMF
ncbi:hypothetical protein Dsin_006795 [Dipteronia sinensis]|uniref:DUF4216 domain-containing protein n=1 Tax=Dipteronia sinensis TaxID=43782 RepID=A0AAE0AZ03_9ROSI|nr:hypothetical protein Dsin_006795 [Dipteronia sinensis]